MDVNPDLQRYGRKYQFYLAAIPECLFSYFQSQTVCRKLSGVFLHALTQAFNTQNYFSKDWEKYIWTAVSITLLGYIWNSIPNITNLWLYFDTLHQSTKFPSFRLCCVVVSTELIIQMQHVLSSMETVQTAGILEWFHYEALSKSVQLRLKLFL